MLAGVRSRRVVALSNGVTVDIVDGPVTAATEYLRWTSIAESFVNLIILPLVALIVAVAVVPVEARQRISVRSGSAAHNPEPPPGPSPDVSARDKCRRALGRTGTPPCRCSTPARS